MTAKTSPDLRFWLLLGESPSGPYSVGQIHDRLASGDITWHTPACVLGGKAWHPLTQTPGIGPVAVDQVEGFVGSKAGESASGETSVARNAETSLPLNNPLPDSTTTSSHDVPNSARIKPVPTLIGSGPSTVMIEGQYSFAVVPLRTIVNSPKGKLSIQTFLVGISQNEGQSWTFVDGEEFAEETVREAFTPKIPPSLKLPKARPVQPVKD